mmetsp:Transcript_13533/g.37142  ORF Transcript_13533/g.37142 Transcript_13533/m.37142 type:complete len:267 (+) Transcript_13533:872-1672(+)
MMIQLGFADQQQRRSLLFSLSQCPEHLTSLIRCFDRLGPSAIETVCIAERHQRVAVQHTILSLHRRHSFLSCLKSLPHQRRAHEHVGPCQQHDGLTNFTVLVFFAGPAEQLRRLLKLILGQQHFYDTSRRNCLLVRGTAEETFCILRHCQRFRFEVTRQQHLGESKQSGTLLFHIAESACAGHPQPRLCQICTRLLVDHGSGWSAKCVLRGFEQCRTSWSTRHTERLHLHLLKTNFRSRLRHQTFDLGSATNFCSPQLVVRVVEAI